MFPGVETLASALEDFTRAWLPGSQATLWMAFEGSWVDASISRLMSRMESPKARLSTAVPLVFGGATVTVPALTVTTMLFNWARITRKSQFDA